MRADPASVLENLNPEQRRAAEAVTGPVAILAGAGTGKTTAITHRIAYQVAAGAFPAGRILAVTFTEKAAGQLKSRLAVLGVDGVEARTFHAAALSQLSRGWERHTGEPLPQLLDSKALMLSSIANALPPPHRFMPRGELASEIEWAKNRLVSPRRYLDALEHEGHVPPIPAEHMLRVYESYEQRKRRAGRIDFEDLLGLTVQLYDEHPSAAAEVHDRFHAFTVDEYQDVNPLQQALLERWLGGRDEICVVGDDYQTIYTFTGATPEFLLGFPSRFPHATVVRLEESYRSSPQILAVANTLGRAMGGFAKELRATRPDGPNPTARALPDAASEIAFVVDESRRLHAAGVVWDEIAVLYRINARSEPYEEAFAAGGIPYQVRDGAFLRRPGPRSVLARLRRAAGDVLEMVTQITDALGYDPVGVPDADEELTRQADLGRLRTLAAEYARAAGDAASIEGFVVELTERFAIERQGRGVQLMTFHRAKGLEFDAVFLPRLLDGELPYRSRRAEADPIEERRLLYVGITRARRSLFLSWPREGRTSPSPFLRDLGVVREPSIAATVARPTNRREKRSAPDDPLFDRLRAWRLDRSRADDVPAYVVFPDKTLIEICERTPRSRAELARVPGVGPTKLDRYGDEVLEIVASG